MSWLDVIIDGQWAEASTIDGGEPWMMIFFFVIDSLCVVVDCNEGCSGKTGMMLQALAIVVSVGHSASLEDVMLPDGSLFCSL